MQQHSQLALPLAAMLSIIACSGAYPLECAVEKFKWLPSGVTLQEDVIGDAVTIIPNCTVPYLNFKWTVYGGDHDQFLPLYSCTSNGTEITSELRSKILPATGYLEFTVEDTSVEIPYGSECTFGGCYHNGQRKIVYIAPVKCAIDIDECSVGQHNCDSNADCNNTVGSYDCSCRPGYTGNGTYCQDVDECSTGLHSCSENADCTNIDGGYSCHCQTGFTGDGFNCTNVDECLTTGNPCGLDPLATCSDAEGSFDCICPEGYEWNSIYCNAVCSSDTCGEHSDCVETNNGYQCVCHPGYQDNGEGKCENIDECGEGTHKCADKCTDTEGSYTCSCTCGVAVELNAETPSNDAATSKDDSCGRIVGLGVVIVLATMFILTLCCGLVALKIACTRKCGKHDDLPGSMLTVEQGRVAPTQPLPHVRVQ